MLVMVKKTVGVGEAVTLTLRETNKTPEKRPSQKDTGIPTIHFQMLYGAVLVSGRVIDLHGLMLKKPAMAFIKDMYIIGFKFK